MREIKFRGKRVDNSSRNFVYGSYLYLNTYEHTWKGDIKGNKHEVHFIIDEDDINIAIDKDSLGQYTGLKDKNNTEIYEGDIVECSYDVFRGSFVTKEGRGIVKFVKGAVCVEFVGKDAEELLLLGQLVLGEIEVIGNIYDELKLLKGDDKIDI